MPVFRQVFSRKCKREYQVRANGIGQQSGPLAGTEPHFESIRRGHQGRELWISQVSPGSIRKQRSMLGFAGGRARFIFILIDDGEDYERLVIGWGGRTMHPYGWGSRQGIPLQRGNPLGDGVAAR